MQGAGKLGALDASQPYELENDMKKVLAVAALALSATSLSAAALTFGDLYGEPAEAALAERTIVVTPGTKYVNVKHGEVVKIVAGGKEFAWDFDGISSRSSWPRSRPRAPSTTTCASTSSARKWTEASATDRRAPGGVESKGAGSRRLFSFFRPCASSSSKTSPRRRLTRKRGSPSTASSSISPRTGSTAGTWPCRRTTTWLFSTSCSPAPTDGRCCARSATRSRPRSCF